MPFLSLFINGLLLILGLMTLLWLISIPLRNVSIVDIFWGVGFVMVTIYYYLAADGFYDRKLLVLFLVSLWGIRLSLYLAYRNIGKPEDYRYQQFRQKYGPHRYWWFSYFQVFLLQGILMWLISAPLLAAMLGTNASFTPFDVAGVVIWSIGFFFESVGDIQLARFKRDPKNKGKLYTGGLWRYTRHPNYFGDAAVWWGYALFSIAAGWYWPVISSVVMTLLLLKVSGVKLLEKSMRLRKGYEDYQKRTSAFIPWFPKSKKE